MRAVLVVVLALLIVGLIVALAVVPSCEDSEFSHFQPVMIGPVINLVPVYDCK